MGGAKGPAKVARQTARRRKPGEIAAYLCVGKRVSVTAVQGRYALKCGSSLLVFPFQRSFSNVAEARTVAYWLRQV